MTAEPAGSLLLSAHTRCSYYQEVKRHLVVLCILTFDGLNVKNFLQYYCTIHTFSTIGDRAFAVAGPQAWNSLLPALRLPSTLHNSFKKTSEIISFDNVHTDYVSALIAVCTTYCALQIVIFTLHYWSNFHAQCFYTVHWTPYLTLRYLTHTARSF